ncbi:Putative conjugal transfer protein, Dtr system [Propionibacterium freudenreichii]|uniref:MobF family relaxase n=2 Tax=Propionibacterium freudenreichii TaxID=1744 RepID=UPI0005A5C45E|nr:MobF family relaxase [Propionibacterium freudenreichii]CEI47065.1 Putative conjugal transfer protein, Dtr system [Propionibacterium freudenreichii]SCQ46466.1 TrwC relaxase [Propionibacterium freudenreichii]SCQ52867.1 TrwC relaxase [Propionibacterium freudenreichii]
MTVSMRVMSAGDGYKYLLKSVAAGDGDRNLSTPLTRYYAEAGSPPGFWLGSGIVAFGRGSLAAGSQVSEQQLQLLIGMGRDPLTGAPLGRAYQQFATVAERVEERARRLGPNLDPQYRAELVARIESEEKERGTRRAVAGFDYTFSVPKSVSAIWAVADAGTQSLIAAAHHAAVAEMVELVEREVAATRVGATGPDGAVAQADVMGVAATAFDHYDSRSHDPQLHTHVVISNKVKTVQDGRWRTLDGRPMHRAVVAISEMYNAVLADHLTRTFGLGWETRERGRDRNPAWEITGVPDELIGEFSTRSKFIEEEKNRLIDTYVARHGRQPSPRTVLKLRAQATLATRPDKDVRSLADLTAQWRQRATHVLSEDATTWAQALTGRQALPATVRADDVPLDVIDQIGQAVTGVVGEKRSTWTRWNLHAEASRQLMGLRFASTMDRTAITGLVVDAGEQASLRLTPPELAVSPAQFRRADGSSRFRPYASTVFSSEHLLEAEDRLLNRAEKTTAPTVPLETIETTTGKPDREGRLLGEDQAAALTAIALSGRVVEVLVGPAGAGKTTAMNALRRAWEAEHGKGSVVGLAPSAVAAQVLADDLGIGTENTAKWLHTHHTMGATFATGQLVIIDEASLAGTFTLDQITEQAEQQDAKVLMVGDWAQLQSVDAGGAFAMLVAAREDAPELTDVHRFTHSWEKRTSLDLRHGHATAIDTLIDHGRVHGAEEEQAMDAAYTAWRTDQAAGKASILVAETQQSVTALNQRARADRIIDGTVNPDHELPLHDGTAMCEGDLVITRRNDRRLRSGSSWVRNGDRWTVTRLREDGSVTVRPTSRRFGGSIVLPASYVAEHLDLGYAVTAHRAQGVTTDTSHVVVTSTTTRENLYVAMTRGREENHAYVAIDRPDDDHSQAHPGGNPDATARSILFGLLQHVGAEPSAHQALAAEQDRWGSIGQLAAEYETIAQEAQADRWHTLLAKSGLTGEQVEDVLASDAYGALSAELRSAEANHHNLDQLLPRLVNVRSFEDADDIASVLHARLARATSHPAGSGRTRRAPRLIAGLIPTADGPMNPEMRTVLNERQRLIDARADAVLDTALSTDAPWIRAFGPQPQQPQAACHWYGRARVVAAYRDRYHIVDAYPLGPAPASTAQRFDRARAETALRELIRPAAETGRTLPSRVTERDSLSR